MPLRDKEAEEEQGEEKKKGKGKTNTFSFFLFKNTFLRRKIIIRFYLKMSFY